MCIGANFKVFAVVLPLSDLLVLALEHPLNVPGTVLDVWVHAVELVTVGLTHLTDVPLDEFLEALLSFLVLSVVNGVLFHRVTDLQDLRSVLSVALDLREGVWIRGFILAGLVVSNLEDILNVFIPALVDLSCVDAVII